MLTKPQADILSMIKNFECVRLTHVVAYTNAVYGMNERQINAILLQLRTMGKIMNKNGFVMLPGRAPKDSTLAVVDIMMSITNGNVKSIITGGKVFNLVFTIPDKAGEENFFGIIMVKPWSEGRICNELKHIQNDITIIFVLEDEEQQHSLAVNSKHYFALMSDEGTYKFFKPAVKTVYTN